MTAGVVNRRQPTVAVIGAGSWGTAVAAIVARHSPTVMWARSAEVAEQINCGAPEQQVPARLSAAAVADRQSRSAGGGGELRHHHHGGAVARFPGSADRARPIPAAVDPGGQPGEGTGTGHQQADDGDRRRGVARSPGRRAGRAEHRPRGGRGLRGRRGDRHAGSAPRRPAARVVPHQVLSDLLHVGRGRRGDRRRLEECVRHRGRDG